MSAIHEHASDLVLVTEQTGRGEALKARVEKIGIPITELAQRVGMTREQVGKILNGDVPGSRSFGKIEHAIEEIELEHGRATPLHTATAAGQIEIEAEGVFGIGRIVVRGDAPDAEASFTRLIERLKQGETLES